MADKQRVIKDPTKIYDANDSELNPGDVVIIRGVYLDQSKTDAGADCRVRIVSTSSGYNPIIAVHGSQLVKEE